MIAPLDLIPGIAAHAVVATADPIHNAHAFVDQTVVDEVSSDLVFDSGPDFISIDERNSRASALRPRTDRQTLFIVDRVNALRVGIIAKIRPEIIFKDRLQSLLHALWRQACI